MAAKSVQDKENMRMQQGNEYKQPTKGFHTTGNMVGTSATK